METKKDVKPLQIRLPADVYQALQYEASAKGSTLNAVVIECLRTNLPMTSWVDMALMRDAGMFADSQEAHTKNALDALDRYQKEVFGEISMLSEMIQLRSTQGANAIEIAKSLREGWAVSQPVEGKNYVSDGKLDISILESRHTGNHAKAEEKVKEGLKLIARARAEAKIYWSLFCKHLDRLNESRKK